LCGLEGCARFDQSPAGVGVRSERLQQAAGTTNDHVSSSADCAIGKQGQSAGAVKNKRAVVNHRAVAGEFSGRTTVADLQGSGSNRGAARIGIVTRKNYGSRTIIADGAGAADRV